MERILKRNLRKIERFTLMYIAIVTMMLGNINYFTCCTNLNTAKEISAMGKNVNCEPTAFASCNAYSGDIYSSFKSVKIGKNIIGKVMSGSSIADMQRMRIQVNSLIKTEQAALKVDGRIGNSEDVCDHGAIISNPIVNSTDPAKGVTNTEMDLNTKKEMEEESTYLEVRGMKIDDEGYVFEITSGVSDGLLVFPTDVHCKGIRASAVENLDNTLRNEITEIWIPANISNIDNGAFDSMKNVNFIEVADGNPVYYSEAGILYYKDGSIACIPQRRIC